MRTWPVFKIAILLLTFFLLRTPIFAQGDTLDPNRAYNDYLYTYDQYRQAHSQYVVAKQAFLNYQTLTSKNEAYEKTRSMLRLRDEVVRTYLAALRTRLAQETKIINYNQNVLYLKLDSEIYFYKNHSEQLSSISTLEDLLADSSAIQKRYQETEVLLYQTLGTIFSDKEAALKEDIGQEIDKIKKKIGQIRLAGNKDTTKAERWSLEAENRLLRSEDKILNAQQILQKMKPSNQDKFGIYNQAIFSFSESHQYLKEANSNLRELVNEIKHAD